jgi:hypothetical protein
MFLFLVGLDLDSDNHASKIMVHERATAGTVIVITITMDNGQWTQVASLAMI